MKERPILFSGPMVRAILEGRKTQTRRVMKNVPSWDHFGKDIMDWGLSGIHQCGYGEDDQLEGTDRWYLDVQTDVDDHSRRVIRCPYGQPGDRLWVRETWGTGGYFPYPYAYRADGVEYPNERWNPSIHMPRAACRLVLEITDVRVERLQAISEADIYAEGAITEEWLEWREDVASIGKPEGSTIERERDVWRRLWSSINGQASWDANPWVWVVGFRRIEA